MSALFLSVPSWLLFVLFVGGSIVLTCLGVLVLRRRKMKLMSNESIGFIFATVSVVYAVLLGFLVIYVWEAFGSAEHAVSEEAAAIVVTARYSASFPEPIRSIMHDRLRHYTELVINDEWPMMQQTGGDRFGSEEGSQDMQAMFNVIQQRLPQTAVTANVLASLGTLSQDRLLRLQSATSIPDYFWLVLIAGGMVVTYLGMILEIENARLHLVLTGLLVTIIAMSLWLAAIINNPFAGDLQVSTDSLQYALHVISLIPR
jgi:threonine/homoserine efflux transporter RhtA